MEFLASRANRKGKNLLKMLQRLLDGDGSSEITDELYKHPLIKKLSVKAKRLTSYIPDDSFSKVIIDLVANNSQSEDDPDKESENKDKSYEEKFREGLQKLPNGDLKKMLNVYFEQAEQKLDLFTDEMKKWYNEYMIRVNHTYKRRLRLPMILIGFVIALFFNIDFFHISTRLWVDANLRDNVVAAAVEAEDNNPTIDSLKLSEEFFEGYKTSLALPIGWVEVFSKDEALSKEYYNKGLVKRTNMVLCHYTGPDKSCWQVFIKLLGLLASGFIASFGAPFWFDLLRKAINIKKVVKADTKS